MAVHLLDLLRRDTQLRRVASTHGGEYEGPCPFCGGDDRFRVWPDAERPSYWCRRCGRKGDAIQYLRAKDGLSYRQACARLGIDPGRRPPEGEQEIRLPSLELDPPGPAWQERAMEFCREAFQALWSAEGAEARAHLLGRGLTEQTIKGARLGYNPEDRYEQAEKWGIAVGGRTIRLPAGIVIPCVVDGHIWRVNIRRGATEPRYVFVSGSQSALFGAQNLSADRPAMLLESELDALLVAQEARDLVTPVATGGTGGARHLYWLSYLARPRLILVSHDADEKGDESTAWWLAHLPHARPWRPLVKDPTEMHTFGLSVREWAEQGAETAGCGMGNQTPRIACALALDPARDALSVMPALHLLVGGLTVTAETELPLVCAACGGAVECFSSEGQPYCKAHLPRAWNPVWDELHTRAQVQVMAEALNHPALVVGQRRLPVGSWRDWNLFTRPEWMQGGSAVEIEQAYQVLRKRFTH